MIPLKYHFQNAEGTVFRGVDDFGTIIECFYEGQCSVSDDDEFLGYDPEKIWNRVVIIKGGKKHVFELGKR